MKIQVVGVGLGVQDLTAQHRGIIARADVLIGGKRLLALFPDSPAEKKVIGKDVGDVIAYIRRRMARRSIVVLASGDPLFYGIGAKLVQTLGPERVVGSTDCGFATTASATSVSGEVAWLKLASLVEGARRASAH